MNAEKLNSNNMIILSSLCLWNTFDEELVVQKLIQQIKIITGN